MRWRCLRSPRLRFALFAAEVVAIETTSLLVLVALAFGFQLFPFAAVSPTDFFFGFGHEALVAICALMVLGRGLVVTGALEPASRLLARMLEASPQRRAAGGAGALRGGERRAERHADRGADAADPGRRRAARKQLGRAHAAADELRGADRRHGHHHRHLDQPDRGGDRRRSRRAPFGMFDFIHVTALAAIPGLLYLWLVLPRLLPERAAPLGDAAPQLFTAVLHVKEGGFADGKPLAEVRKKAGGAPDIRRVLRGEAAWSSPRLPTLTLRAGRPPVRQRAAPRRCRSSPTCSAPRSTSPTTSSTRSTRTHPLAAENERLAEVVVTEGSLLSGSTLRATRFGDSHEVTIVGLHRGRRPRPRANDIGDVVLRRGRRAAGAGHRRGDPQAAARARGLLVLDQSYELPRTRTRAARAGDPRRGGRRARRSRSLPICARGAGRRRRDDPHALPGLGGRHAARFR